MSKLENCEHFKLINPELGLTKFLLMAEDNSQRDNTLDDNRLSEAEAVIHNIEIVMKDFKKLPLYDTKQEYYQNYLAIIISGIYLYYLYKVDVLPNASLMLARDMTKDYVDEAGLRVDPERIYEIASAACGADGPEMLRPRPDTPNELFALAKFLHEHRNAIK